MTDKFWISPSQIDTFNDCPRSWWFRYARKMPVEEKQEQFDYGNVLHEAAERWLKADDRGYDESGKPVDIFPKGWASKVNSDQAKHIKELLELGIKEGVLRRLPDRQVEVWMKHPVGVGNVWIRGVIDQLGREVIEDHKTTSSRRWALGKKKLRQDNKMLSYAWWEWKRHPERDVFRLRLNYFNKKELEVWEVTTPVTALELQRWEQDILLPTATDMQRYTEVEDHDWEKVEGPRVKDACKKYN